MYKETFLGNGLEVNIFIFCIALPLIVTIFNARVISPVMGLWFYEKDCETKERKKRAKRKAAEIAEKEVSEEKLERLVIQENVLEKEMAINIRKQDIEREKTKEEVWTDEYNAFREAVPTGLRSLYSSIYEHNGLIMDTLSTFILPTDIVALADANGIIEKNANIIRLTEKGQFFMKLYIKDKIARKQG